MSRGRIAAGRGFTLVELLISVAIISLLAAIAVPNMMRFQARAKQSEAKTVLKAYAAAQSAYFAEVDSYTDQLDTLGFSPERGNRYAYLASVAPSAWQGRSTVSLGHPGNATGVEVDCWKLGGASCVAHPGRPSPIGFTVTYQPGRVGPTDTGVVPGPAGGYLVEARGAIDVDAEVDVWLLSSGALQVTDSTCAEPVRIGAGAPVNVYDDVLCP